MAPNPSNTGRQPHTVPLSEAAAKASWPNPEFVDCKGLEAGWGIKRSLAYALLAEGKIQGVSLRRRNRVRGKRLFEVDSVRAFLKSQMESAMNYPLAIDIAPERWTTITARKGSADDRDYFANKTRIGNKGNGSR